MTITTLSSELKDGTMTMALTFDHCQECPHIRGDGMGYAICMEEALPEKGSPEYIDRRGGRRRFTPPEDGFPKFCPLVKEEE